VAIFARPLFRGTLADAEKDWVSACATWRELPVAGLNGNIAIMGPVRMQLGVCSMPATLKD
jgi:hypothetical protein